jgi:hypothetical protein
MYTTPGIGAFTPAILYLSPPDFDCLPKADSIKTILTYASEIKHM